MSRLSRIDDSPLYQALFLKCRTVVLNRSVSHKKQLGQLFDIGLETKPSLRSPEATISLQLVD